MYKKSDSLDAIAYNMKIRIIIPSYFPLIHTV